MSGAAAPGRFTLSSEAQQLGRLREWGIVLLYFDRRRAAAEVAGLFFVANMVFTLATVLLGPRTYGLGYPLAALLACAWAYHRLEQTLDDLEYLTFAAQPMAPEVSAVEASPSASI